MVNLSLLRRHALPLVLLTILAVSLGVNARLKDRPLLVGDTPDYIAQAWNLTQHSLLTQDLSPEPRPVLGREPGYPLVLAALMRTTGLAGFTPACLEQPALCERAIFLPALWLGMGMVVAAAGLLGWAAFRLTGSRRLGVLGFGYLALNWQLWSWRHYLQSDYLALLLLCALTALLAEWGLRQRRHLAAAAGLALGGLILVKAVFLWFLPPAALGWALLRWRAPGTLPRHGGLLLALAALPLPTGCCATACLPAASR